MRDVRWPCRLRLLIVTALVAFEPMMMVRAEEPGARRRADLGRSADARKSRRSRRDHGPVGVIVPYPMPPALVIRQTHETHDEVQDLLRLLRGY